MNSFIVIFALAAVVIGAHALTDEQVEKIKAYHKDCAAESKVDAALVEKARQGDFADDEKLKVHLLCFSKKAGFQNEAGEIQKDVIFKKLNAELNDEAATNALIEKCLIKKDKPEETAFETIKCYKKNTPKNITIA